jgi:SAM-dependent methyltransferase
MEKKILIKNEYGQREIQRMHVSSIPPSSSRSSQDRYKKGDFGGGSIMRTSTKPQSFPEIERLWDSFWVQHGRDNRIFDRLLWFVRSFFSRRHAKLLLEHWRGNPKQKSNEFQVLEIGCGSATTSYFISSTSRGATNYVIDLSLPAIRIARSRNPDFRCVVADALALPFADGVFSLVFSSGVIEHFDRNIAHEMIKEHWRVTGNQETVSVIVPWRYSILNLVRILSRKHWPFGHENPFSIRELHSYITRHPVCDVTVRSVYWTTLIAMAIRGDGGDKITF